MLYTVQFDLFEMNLFFFGWLIQTIIAYRRENKMNPNLRMKDSAKTGDRGRDWPPKFLSKPSLLPPILTSDTKPPNRVGQYFFFFNFHHFSVIFTVDYYTLFEKNIEIMRAHSHFCWKLTKTGRILIALLVWGLGR
jgi:hypothetical protein